MKRSTDAYIEYLRSLENDQLAAKKLQQQDERNKERPEILAKIQHNQKIWQRNMHRWNKNPTTFHLLQLIQLKRTNLFPAKQNRNHETSS